MCCEQQDYHATYSIASVDKSGARLGLLADKGAAANLVAAPMP